MKRLVKGPWLWIVVAVVGVLLALQYLAPNGGYDEVETSQLESYITKGEVKEITFVGGDQQIQATLDDGVRDDGDKVSAYWVAGQQQGIINEVDQQVAKGTIEQSNSKIAKPSVIGSFLFSVLPFVVIFLVFLWLLNNMQGGGGRGVMQFGKSKAKLISKDMPKTTFTDVAGCDEAIEELGEIKEFLQEPAKFQAVGAKIPKGVLLYGPPGTGKTLLARAVAGEAGVPFYSISGSDFVEMFVGVGASRVRDLFEQAKENAPAIVFIDEIDAVGRHRGAGMGGGHDEREQTLNQLLVEMDGFDVRGGVILIAATNRPDVLDPALLRPGRFDRQIGVDAPDLAGRHMILKVHSRGKPMAPDIDLLSIARRTPGFTGADLANVLNEAALLTARQNQKLIGNQALDEAIDRVIAGPQRSSRLMSEKEKLITAYHEGGHALVAAALPGTDPVHKITILPRGRALGYTMVLPDEDKYSQTRSEMLDKLAYMLGGRAAEEMVFHDPTTGAGNDIEKATNLARAMVTQYGMTERLGAIKLGESNSEPFLGRDLGHQRNYSEDVAAKVDEETKKLLATAHQEAFDILEENRDVLDPWCSSSSTRRPSTRREVAEVFEPLRRRSGPPGLDRLARPQPLGASRRSRSRRRSATGRRRTAPRRPRPASILTPPGSGGDVHGDPGASAAGRPRPGAARRDDRPDRVGPPAPRGGPGVRPRPRRGGGPRAADRDRGGPRARGAARHPGPGGPGVRRADRRAAADARGRAHHDLRHRPRRDGAGARHRAVVDVRAPPGAVHRRRPRRLHPGRERQDHRPVQAGPARRRLRQAAAGAGAADHPGRRRPDGDPRGPRRDRRDRGRAPLHDDARGPQGRRPDHHLRGARHDAQRRHPLRGDGADPPRALMPDAGLAVRPAGTTPADGRRQRHARLVLRRRPLGRAGRRDRARPRPARRRGRHPRHRR